MLNGAQWVTKDHLINLFLGCKKVILSKVRYDGEELFEIGQKWLECPEMKFLEIQESYVFSANVGRLPGAVPVVRVTVIDARGCCEELKFGARRCYKMEKADGTPAIIYHDSGATTFTTSFENAVVGEVPVVVERFDQWRAEGIFDN